MMESSMDLNELKLKYQTAHRAYLNYKDINKTNNIEAEFVEKLKPYHKQIFGTEDISYLPDCFLNYVGVDYIDPKTGKTWDLKVCQHLHGTEVLIDAYKHDKAGNWYNALNDKINDLFIFVNADNIIIVNADDIRNRIDQGGLETFFMKRDIYQTTKKAVIDLRGIRKVVLAR